MTQATSIANVDFGSLDAESEHNLTRYFVDTGVFQRLSSGDKAYVIGRKGSGKTAIFRESSDARVGHATIKLDFENYSWPVHMQIREEGVPEEASYVASWKFTFLVNVCKAWLESAPLDVAQEALEMISKIFGGSDPDPLEVLIDKFRRLRKVEFPTPLGGVGIELDEKGAAPPAALAQSISLWNEKLQNFVVRSFVQAPFSVLVDRLDDGWDGSEQARSLLAGALKAARSINIACGRPHHAAPVIVFLRSDIFDALQFNDKNKIQAAIEYLDWTEESLAKIVATRIDASLKTGLDDAWAAVFTQEEMRQRSKVRNYIIRRTMHRPRDMVAFCNACKDSAVKQGHAIVGRDDVYEAERAYSKHIYDELDDETHKQLPRFREIMQTLRDVNLHRFRFEDWLKACQTRNGNVGEGEARQDLKVLFDYSVVGVQRKGGSSGGTQFIYLYTDRLLEPNFVDEMIVHPSLRKHLNIREARASTGRGPAGDLDALDPNSGPEIDADSDE